MVDSVEMSDIESRLAAPTDSRGRVVSIFVGAVLLPSIALSVLSFNAVPKHAENLKISLQGPGREDALLRGAGPRDRGPGRALEAARAVGTERAARGTAPGGPRGACARPAWRTLRFDSLRLEAWSHGARGRSGPPRAAPTCAALREALGGFDLPAARRGGGLGPADERRRREARDGALPLLLRLRPPAAGQRVLRARVRQPRRGLGHPGERAGRRAALRERPDARTTASR